MSDEALRAAARARDVDPTDKPALWTWAVLVHRHKPRGVYLTPDDLDDMEDAGYDITSLAGARVMHDCFGAGVLSILANGNAGVRIRMKCPSHLCRARTTVYLISGLHHGAYAYATDRYGFGGKGRVLGDGVLIDLRNCGVLCRSCRRRRNRQDNRSRSRRQPAHQNPR